MPLPAGRPPRARRAGGPAREARAADAAAVAGRRGRVRARRLADAQRRGDRAARPSIPTCSRAPTRRARRRCQGGPGRGGRAARFTFVGRRLRPRRQRDPGRCAPRSCSASRATSTSASSARAGRTRVSVRSKSRVGQGDLGQNARNMRGSWPSSTRSWGGQAGCGRRSRVPLPRVVPRALVRGGPAEPPHRPRPLRATCRRWRASMPTQLGASMARLAEVGAGLGAAPAEAGGGGAGPAGRHARHPDLAHAASTACWPSGSSS